tara:strand:+ start:670 stop:1188 length:519 start_codon:yes stop_codon:yes gene_type:complete
MYKIEKMITKNSLKNKILELSSLISNQYSDDNIVILGVMNGGFYFMHDLIKTIPFDHSYDFLFCSSYYGNVKTSGKVKFVYPNKVDIANKNVLILEDIIDTGNTISKIRSKIFDYKPKNVEIATLLIRQNCKLDFKLFWSGYKIKNEFVVGYGLDYNEKYRNLEDIYKLIID